MKEIVFVTTNRGKVASAQKYFKNIKLVPHSHELIEPRSMDLREIAWQKVKQAYELVGRPCIALDSGFYIGALNGFPNTYVNHTLDTIGLEGILKLMEGVEDRGCEFRSCLAYYDGERIEYFESRSKGRLSENEIGEDNKNSWSELWYIFMPEKFEKTLAQFNETDFILYEELKEDSCIKKFGDWYEKDSLI